MSIFHIFGPILILQLLKLTLRGQQLEKEYNLEQCGDTTGEFEAEKYSVTGVFGRIFVVQVCLLYFIFEKIIQSL